MMKTEIDTIIFDLGRVLIDFDFDPFTSFLKWKGAAMESIDEFYAKFRLLDYERGQLSTDEFFAHMNSLLARPVDDAELRQRWIEMYEPLHPMLSLSRRLREHYRVFVLSNIGELQWHHILKTYEVADVAHDLLPSFEAGSVKPETKIFVEAEKRWNLTPAKTIFIDDREDNISAAAARGWKTIQHFGTQQTLSQLQRCGISQAAF